MKSRLALVAILLALQAVGSGCQGAGPTGAGKAKPGAGATTRHADVAASPATGPSGGANPGSAPSPPIGSAATAPDGELLRRPAAPSTVLSGRVYVDAGYAAAIVGSGRDGIATFGPSGAGSASGGNRIAAAASVLIDGDGTPLIGDSGGAIIGNNGSGVISNNGGGVVSNNGGGYRLAVAGPPTNVAIPAAGLLVGVIDLDAGKPLPLGVDAADRPVFLVRSAADAGFTVFLPAASGGNVMVVTAAGDLGDPRFSGNAIVNLRLPAVGDVDEVSTTTTRLIRETFFALIDDSIWRSQGQVVPGNNEASDLLMDTIVKEFTPVAIAKLSGARRRRAIQRSADQMLAAIDLAAIRNVGYAAAFEGRGSFGELRAVADDVLSATARRLAQNPTYFDDRDYTRAANANRPADQAFKVRRAADLLQFIKDAIPSKYWSSQPDVPAILDDLRLPRVHATRQSAAVYALGTGLVQQLGTTPEVLARLKVTFEAIVASEVLAQAPSEPVAVYVGPPPPVSRPFEAIVTKLAGPSATSVGKTPISLGGMVALASGDLFVTSPDQHQLWRLFRGIDDPMVWVAGSGLAGSADGAAYGSAFDRPSGLANVGGRLYLADRQGQAIRVVDDPEGDRRVSTLVGRRDPDGVRDGPAATAILGSPGGLAASADGRTLYFTDASPSTGYVRAVDLVDPAHPVHTLLATPIDVPTRGDADGIADPGAIAWHPDGFLLVTERTGSAIWRLALDGTVTSFAGLRRPGRNDGPVATATFEKNGALAVDAGGNVYVGGATIRRIGRDGQVASLAPPIAAALLAVDASGVLLAANYPLANAAGGAGSNVFAIVPK